MLTLLSLVAGTFVSEDLACITAGLLVERGEVGSASAIAACALGIFAGDVGLWAIGRVFGRAALEWRWMARRLDSDGLQQCRSWLDRHAGRTIVASRFLPGARLPLYVVAGFVGLPAAVFAGWALVGAVLWTPVIVLLAARLGDAFTATISSAFGAGWKTDAVFSAAMLLLVHTMRSCRWRPLFLGDHGRV